MQRICPIFSANVSQINVIIFVNFSEKINISFSYIGLRKTFLALETNTELWNHPFIMCGKFSKKLTNFLYQKVNVCVREHIHKHLRVRIKGKKYQFFGSFCVSGK